MFTHRNLSGNALMLVEYRVGSRECGKQSNLAEAVGSGVKAVVNEWVMPRK